CPGGSRGVRTSDDSLLATDRVVAAATFPTGHPSGRGCGYATEQAVDKKVIRRRRLGACDFGREPRSPPAAWPLESTPSDDRARGRRLHLARAKPETGRHARRPARATEGTGRPKQDRRLAAPVHGPALR